MRVDSVHLRNFRSFDDSGVIGLDAMNVLVGPNNAGKSSILRALYLMQEGAGTPWPDVRLGANHALIEASVSDASAQQPFHMLTNGRGRFVISMSPAPNRREGQFSLQLYQVGSDAGVSVGLVSSVDPQHFVVPYLSKRKTASYNEDVRLQLAMQVSPHMGNLAAKLSRVTSRSFPGGELYEAACREILGFVVTAVPSDNGQRPGIYLPNREVVPIDQMGEGVPNIVALLVDLTLSTGKLFLVEEPENDLHPEALKALLELMIDSAKRNQFVVSTHSNIVVRHLGAAVNSRVFHVGAKKGSLPTTATVEQVPNTPQARLDVLRQLGYSLTDFDLWSGWLIVEESSAERIIRDYLIPWFAPKLSRVRTLATNGTSKVEATFADFDRLMRFAHLEPIYSNAAWVRVDADASGRDVVEKLQNTYKTWDADHFGCFSKEQFEHYYPAHFAEKVDQVLAIPDRQQKRSAKRQLLEEVRLWLDEDEVRGRTALGASAKDVIDELKRIEDQLK